MKMQEEEDISAKEQEAPNSKDFYVKMDPTREFFCKLRKVVVSLETETAKLRGVFEDRNKHEDGDIETTARAMRAYHEVNGEVCSLKEQVRDELADQKERQSEVRNFIKACGVMEQRVSKDIQAVRTHLEKYGYQAPSDAPTPGKLRDQEAEAESKEDKSSLTVGEDGKQEEDEGVQCSPPPQNEEQLPTDAMRTPQLSDFGLSVMQLKRSLAVAEWCSEVPPMPELHLPSLKTPVPPTLAMTPKCALRMDEDELQMPQMHHFGIFEHTVCLNNDFTMNLLLKKSEKRPQDTAAPTVTSEEESLQTKADKLKSPELPSLCTLGLKIKKANGLTPEQNKCESACPGCPGSPPSTPEVPPFQTPYLKRLGGTKKSEQPEPIDMQSDEDNYVFNLETPCNGSTKHKWEYKVPEMAIFSVEDKQMPEIPQLESSLGNYLQIKNKNTMKMCENGREGKDTSLELDGPTHEFSLGTPRLRSIYQEPSTPEMPELSSVTQDICKLLSRAQMKKTTASSQQPHVKTDNRQCPVPQTKSCLSAVSRSEFQTLPGYLRQMTLSNLNQAINNINRYVTECGGAETSTFTTEELRRISSVGTMAPVYFLCLKELQRLTQVEDIMSTEVYKLKTQN